MQGYADLPHGVPVNQDAVKPAPQPDFQQGLDDLHRIAQKYDGPPVENIQPFNLAPGKTITIDYTQTPHNSIIINIESGTLKLWTGTQLAPSAVGYLTFLAGGNPVQLMFDTAGRYYTLGCDPLAPGAALGCFWIVRL